METFDPTNNIGYLLQHLSTVLSKQTDQILSERLGIGFSQYKILLVLQANPRTRQKHIAERLGQTEASVSRQISLMFGKNLLQTTINPSNRREHVTTPTAKGLRLVNEAQNLLNGFHGPMFDKLSAKQRESLLESLVLMHQTACQSGRIGACDHPFLT